MGAAARAAGLSVRGRGAAAAAGPGGDAEHSWRAGYIWSGFQRAGPGPAPPPPARESAPAAEATGPAGTAGPASTGDRRGGPCR